MLFFPLINVKMPIIVGILTFMSRKNFIVELSMKKVYITSGPGYYSIIFDIKRYLAGGAQLSRDIQNEPCYTSITLFCLKEIEFK